MRSRSKVITLTLHNFFLFWNFFLVLPFFFRYCDTPKSVAPFDWGPNISEWPVCQRRTAVVPRREAHMHCEVMGRPCCIQMHGQCRITTREYCEFVRGYYHENAILCSQVSCLNDVCGMTPFLAKERPDQFYRFFIPLFIHAG